MHRAGLLAILILVLAYASVAQGGGVNQLAHFSLEMGWMTSGELRRVAVDGARDLLARPLTSDVIDVMCEITKRVDLGTEFGSDDFSSGVFGLAEGVLSRDVATAVVVSALVSLAVCTFGVERMLARS